MLPADEFSGCPGRLQHLWTVGYVRSKPQLVSCSKRGRETKRSDIFQRKDQPSRSVTSSLEREKKQR